MRLNTWGDAWKAAWILALQPTTPGYPSALHALQLKPVRAAMAQEKHFRATRIEHKK
jgi:hypothetical protein